jgi:hypothetical protein
MFPVAYKAFNNAGSPDINNWTLKTTGTVSVGTMFGITSIFNQPIGSWNMIAVASLGGMFKRQWQHSTQNINSWNVSNVQM